jgi:hypothetical protein|tara:strand:- start:385 stop:600 length:216 start_codon:yes stop_codon:yes gene_type:complete
VFGAVDASASASASASERTRARTASERERRERDRADGRPTERIAIAIANQRTFESRRVRARETGAEAIEAR